MDNENTSESSASTPSNAKSKTSCFRGPWTAYALTAVVALILGFAIGRCCHHRHCDGGRCGWGNHEMMRGDFGDEGGGAGEMREGMPPMGMHGFDPAERVERMKQALGLTDQQAGQIKSIFEQQRAKMESAMKGGDSAHRPDWRAGRDQIKSQIDAVLTPEQRTKWQQMMPDRMGRRE